MASSMIPKPAKTGRFIKAKEAAASPATTFKVNDYPARMLRKLIRLWESETWSDREWDKLIANIKRRMGWK